MDDKKKENHGEGVSAGLLIAGAAIVAGVTFVTYKAYETISGNESEQPAENK